MRFWAVSVATPEMMWLGRIHLVVEAVNENDARIIAKVLCPSANLWDIIVSADIAPPETWIPRA